MKNPAPAKAPNPLAGTLETLNKRVRPRLARLMGYYRNRSFDLADYLPTRSTTVGVRPYRQYQEIGLPMRITGFRSRDAGEVLLAGPVDATRREVVVENDIGWRLHTLVDFCVGQMPVITSTAPDAATRTRLSAAIQQAFDAAGGVGLLQELVLMGAIHGSAYVGISPSDDIAAILDGGQRKTAPASHVRLTLLPATRVVPVFEPGAPETSGATLAACAIVAEKTATPAPSPGARDTWLDRVGTWVRAAVGANATPPAEIVDLCEPGAIVRFNGDIRTREAPNPLGFVPVIGYVNQQDPAGGPLPGLGLSDVEPLIPLQDELNTRLSDRANRVTMQSFRMYLAKGIEDFSKRPVGPGQLWATDNPDAAIVPFGGDNPSPSEESHINEIREAMDKISGVTPVAAGLLRGKVGNLTSAVALRVTLIALLARTERKRANLELTIAAVCRRVLELLDRAGIVPSNPDDRGIEINWPSAIPENVGEKLAEAQMKLALGIPRSMVLAELGYDAIEIAQASKGDSNAQTTPPASAPDPANEDGQPRGESPRGPARPGNARHAGNGNLPPGATDLTASLPDPSNLSPDLAA